MAPLNFGNLGHLLFKDVARECDDYSGKGFAAHCGVTGSTVCRWGKPSSDNDSLPVPAWAVDALADFTGRPDVVYRRQLARHGWRPVPDPVVDGDTGARAPAAAQLAAQVAGLTVSVLKAEADGKLDPRERASLASDLEAIAQRVAGLRAGLGRVG